jgi:hypothetical protein
MVFMLVGGGEMRLSMIVPRQGGRALTWLKETKLRGGGL